MILPDSHRAIVFDPSFEGSSTDDERLVLLLLGIKTARPVLQERHSRMSKFLDIRTNSSALECQVNLGNSRHLKVSVEVPEILRTMRDWGHLWSLSHHKGTNQLLKRQTRSQQIFFFPPLSRRGHRKIQKHLKCTFQLIKTDPTQPIVHSTLPTAPTGDKSVVYVFPMNLSMTMYYEALAKLTVLKPQFVLCPFLKLVSGALQVRYYLKCKILTSDFKPQHPECSSSIIPHGFYVLGEADQAGPMPPSSEIASGVPLFPSCGAVTKNARRGAKRRVKFTIGPRRAGFADKFPRSDLISNSRREKIFDD